MSGRRRLASLQELIEKRTLKFSYWQEGIEREGFLAWFDGQVVCYENVCRHVPITLDYGDGRFLNPAGTHFVCSTHGATYEPVTGKCISGPCVGASLKALPVRLEAGEIWLEDLPEEP